MNTTSVSYERSLTPNWSASIGFGRRFKGKLPGFARSEKLGLSFSNTGLRAYVAHGEARWYLKKCEEFNLLEGFYIGSYFKYNHFDLETSMILEEEDGSILENNAEVRLSEYGLGLSMGYQLQLWDRLAIDFLFFGPRTECGDRRTQRRDHKLKRNL